jgi:hypothetical protein
MGKVVEKVKTHILCLLKLFPKVLKTYCFPTATVVTRMPLTVMFNAYCLSFSFNYPYYKRSRVQSREAPHSANSSSLLLRRPSGRNIFLGVLFRNTLGRPTGIRGDPLEYTRRILFPTKVGSGKSKKNFIFTSTSVRQPKSHVLHHKSELTVVMCWHFKQNSCWWYKSPDYRHSRLLIYL